MSLVFADHGQPLALHNVLQSIASQRTIAAYLEVGVCWGSSLRAVLSQQHPGRLALCDTWGGEYGGESFGGSTHIKEMLARENYRCPVHYLDGDSHDLLKTVTQQFDLILVDGDHSAAGALEDLNDCWSLLTPGGLLVFDDLAHPSHPELCSVFNEFAEFMDATVVHIDLRPMGVGVLCKTL